MLVDYLIVKTLFHFCQKRPKNLAMMTVRTLVYNISQIKSTSSL